MSLKRLISCVSAFAVAASAFAAMTVTASADTTYTRNATGAMMTEFQIGHDSNFVFTADSYDVGTKWSGVAVDFTSMPDIAKASVVKVEFDAVVNSGGQVLFGVGDKDTRGNNMGGSSKSAMNSSGLAFILGTTDGSDYKAIEVARSAKLDVGAANLGKEVHATVQLNRKTNKFSFAVTDKATGTSLQSYTNAQVANGVSNFTALEAYTNVGGATFILKNVKVSYTVPEAPPTYVTSEVEATDNVGDDGVYARAFTTDITYKGIAINNVKVEVPGSVEGSQKISFGGISGDVSIGIIIASKDASKIAGVTPTVTVNAE